MGAYFSATEDGEDSVQPQNFPSEVLDKYLVERVIGKGAFGTVYEVVDRRSNAKLAMKRVEGHSGAYSKEAAMQRGCESEHVVKVVETILSGAPDTSCLYIVMELCEGGNLRDWMRRAKANRLHSEIVVLQMLLEICAAVESCHQNKVVHRDLKPENILLDSQGRVKLTDFGVARHLKTDIGASTFCGTPAYMAPELYLSYISKMEGSLTQRYDYKCDVWSIGCLLLEMAAKSDINLFYFSYLFHLYNVQTQRPPSSGGGAINLGYDISQVTRAESKNQLDGVIAEYVPEDYTVTRKLLKGMLVRHPEQRIDVKDILLDSDIRKKLENPPHSHWFDGLLDSPKDTSV